VSASDRETEHWVGTWACSPQLADAGSRPPAPGFADVTLRQIVHVSIGGRKIRLRFSNAFGKSALRISSAHVAIAAGGSQIKARTDKPLTFDEESSVAIPEGDRRFLVKRSEEHTSELQSRGHLVCRLLLEK